MNTTHSPLTMSIDVKNLIDFLRQAAPLLAGRHTLTLSVHDTAPQPAAPAATPPASNSAARRQYNMERSLMHLVTARLCSQGADPQRLTHAQIAGQIAKILAITPQSSKHHLARAVRWGLLRRLGKGIYKALPDALPDDLPVTGTIDFTQSNPATDYAQDLLP